MSSITSCRSTRSPLSEQARARAPGNPLAAEVASKVDNLVQCRFNGNVRDAFNHYAGSNGELSRDEVKSFLRDTNIGPNFPPVRNAIAGRLMDEFDSNRDNSVSWQEFSNGARRYGVTM